VVAPALTVLFDFAQSAPIEATSTSTPLPTRTHPTVTHRREARRGSVQSTQAQLQQPNPDSLSTLRARPPLRETPVYRLTATSSGRPDADPTEDRVGWGESTPPVRTVSGTVLAAARQISIGRVPHGHERDRDVR
jgi:hypothetical protein